jgi:primosomal protein N' (replication factor Y)
MAPFLAIAIDTPLRRLFDYRPPAAADPSCLTPGQRLWVPFGKRRAVGILVELRSETEVPQHKLRPAHEVIDIEPVIDPVLLRLLVWSAEYYRHPIGEVLHAAIPAMLRHGREASATRILWELTDLGRREALVKLGPRAHRMGAVVQSLSAGAQDSELLQSTIPGWRESMRKLASKGYVISRGVPATHALAASTPPRSAVPTLTPEQQSSVTGIIAALGSFRTLLLQGVTGSGKTEVYLRVLEVVIERGQQALVLVPEIALTPQLIARFEARLGSRVAVLHSALTDTERLDAWRASRDGSACVVVGTRSAVFAPLRNIGVIVIDEEHDASYKQQEGFRYSARDMAISRAQRHGIPIVLGSATPSFESLLRVERQPHDLLSLPRRAGNAQPPRMQFVDLRKHGAQQGLATPTLFAIERHLAAQSQVLLYLNRRGYAPVLFCPSCGWSAVCIRCDARLTVHRSVHKLVCHHCGAEQAPFEVCPSCSAQVKPVGQGTERIEETLAKLFPYAPLARIDRDSMRRKGELEATLERVSNGEIRLLVGTQMLAKGHHFPRVTLVVVLNADQGLFSSDFRAGERLAQSIVQVAGRAGRAEHPGEVLIQSEYPDHPLLQQLLIGGYEAFAAAALREREAAHWPPFTRLALLRAEAPSPALPFEFLECAREVARQFAAKVRVLGPAPAPMARRAGQYRAQLLLHAPSHGPLHRVLAHLIPELETLPNAKRVRWSVDVDPIELF